MDFTRFVPILFIVGGLCFWNARRRFLTMRRIEDTARSKAASAPQGQVELQGIAWPEGENAIVSSTGSEVVYHSLKLQREETRGAGKSRRKEWVTVFHKEHAPPFFLLDATGLVRVDPVGAELDLVSSRTQTWRGLSQPQKQHVLGATAGQAIGGFPPSDFALGLFSSPFRIVESEIRVGSPVYAQGDFRSADGAGELARSRALTLFHARFFDPARRAQKKLDEILDADGDGKASAQEAIDGLCRAAASDRETTKRSASVESEFPVHGRLATSPQHKLFVADRHEENLVQEKTWGVYLPFVGGVAAVSAALVLMTTGGRGTTKPLPQAAAAAVPAPALHSELRGACMSGKPAACEELLRRSVELRVPDNYRREYAQQACRLGLRQHCAE